MVKPTFAKAKHYNGEWLWDDEEIKVATTLLNAGKDELEVSEILERSEKMLKKKLSEIGYYKEIGRGRTRKVTDSDIQLGIVNELKSIKQQINDLIIMVGDSNGG